MIYTMLQKCHRLISITLHALKYSSFCFMLVLLGRDDWTVGTCDIVA